jgi:subtilase family serine protease
MRLRAARQYFSVLLKPDFLRLTTTALLLSTLTFAAAQDRILRPIDSSHTIALARSVHPKAKPQYDQGAVGPQTNFGYVTLMTSPSASQQKALDELMAEQQNPSSPNYHRWLTPEEYGNRFGLSQNDLNKITAWLKAQGFTVISVAGGRNSIVFSGTAAQIETAFGTEIHRYNIGKEEHFSNSTAVKIPAAWAGVVTGIRGLNSFRMKPMNVKKRLHGDYYSSALQSQFLAPGDIATIYDINPLYTSSPAIDGTGQKLAIVGQTDIYIADINDFRTGFGLPAIPTSGSNSCSTNSSGVVVSCSNATNLGYVVVTGSSDPGTPNVCGDLPEADLDIEWSGATARNAQIIYVNAPVTFDSNCNFVSGGGVEAALTQAINPPIGPPIAPVISMSYGICEQFAQDDEMELKQANAEGITILNSSGDTAAAGCDGFTNSDNNLALGGLAVNYPASSQRVTGVGGTAVPFNDFGSPFWNTTNANNGGSAQQYIPEQAWNDVDEFAAACAAGFVNPNFCSFYGITSPLAAQEALGIGGGGGGASNCAFEPAPGICQPPWQTVSIPGQASARFVPDVSLLATPNFPGYIWCTPVEYLSSTSPYDTETSSSCAISIADSVNGILDSSNNFVVSPSIVGGTSVSAPVFAGIVALLNQYVVEKGIQSTPGLGNINPNLYYLAAYDQNAFHQITSGDSYVYCQPGTPVGQPAALMCPDSGVFGYQASNADTATGNGYNLVTGLGSVDVFNLASDWVDSTTPVFTLAVPSIVAVVNQPITWNGTLTAFNGYASSVSLSCTGAAGTCGIVNFTPSTKTPTSTGAPFGLAVGSSATGFSAPVAYNFNVSGSDGTLTHTHAVSLTVNTDVTISAAPSNPPAVNAGQSTSTTNMSVSPVGSSNFTAPVTFACTGLPAGATCSISPVAAGSAANTPVTITVQTAGPFTGTASGIARPATRSQKLHSQKLPLWLPLGLPFAGLVLVGLAGCGVPRRFKIVGLCLTLALTGLLVACGGGGGSSSPPPPSVNVSVSPGAATLYPNLTGAPPQTQQFSATVTPITGSQNVSQSVTWSVSGGSGNGTISSTGLYTAPASLPSSNAVAVTATSPDPGTPGSATVNLLSPTPSGTYPITVAVMTSGSAVHQTSFNLTVN